MNSTRSSLYPSEWLLVSSIFLVLFALLVLSKVQAFRTGGELVSIPIPVEVTLTGHVSKPGTYLFDLGTPLSECIVKAKPRAFADLSYFEGDERLAGSCQYIIEPLSELTIWVEGACQSEELKVPPKTRICDLKKKIQLHSEADLTFFKKRRCLENKEIIKIPSKKTIGSLPFCLS